MQERGQAAADETNDTDGRRATTVCVTTPDGEILEADTPEELQDKLAEHLEYGEHLTKRESVLEALGKRAQRGDNQYGADTVSAPLTTEDIARELEKSGRAVRVPPVLVAENLRGLTTGRTACCVQHTNQEPFLNPESRISMHRANACRGRSNGGGPEGAFLAL